MSARGYALHSVRSQLFFPSFFLITPRAGDLPNVSFIDQQHGLTAESFADLRPFFRRGSAARHPFSCGQRVKQTPVLHDKHRRWRFSRSEKNDKIV